LKGVCDYFAFPISDAGVFGKSGHTFLINVQQQLCPSGPYCLDWKWFITQIRHLGISMQSRGFFSAASSVAERHAVEATLRAHLDRGLPCSLLNMENQLITGYMTLAS